MRIIRENIYDMKQTLDTLYDNNLLNTNIKELKPTNKFNQSSFFLVEDYLNDYNNHLKDVERDYKNRRNIKCIQIEISFKFTKSQKYLKSITNKVIDYFTTGSYFLPYISFVNENNNKLTLIIFDRYFYPNGKSVDVLAKSDYKSGKFKKGDVVRTKKMYMSHKIRIFNFATKEQLSKYFEILRQYVISGDKEIDKDTLSDKQYVNKDGKHYKRKRKELFYKQISEYRMRKIRAYNMLIRTIKLNAVSLSEDVLKSFRKQINTGKSVFEFEQDVLLVIQTI